MRSILRRVNRDMVGSKTVRLAAAYLGVIMLLSAGFSAAFYKTSTTNLPVTYRGGEGTVGGSQRAAGRHLSIVGSDGRTRATQNQGEIDELNRQVQHTIDALHANLLRRLLFFNLGIFVVGGGISFYLARRTLRPMEAALAAQSAFASDASHELRTPLAVMQAENEGALRTLDLAPPVRELVQSNLEEIAHLKQLSDALLRLAQDTKQLPLCPLFADMVVAQAVQRTAKSAHAKNIQVSYNVPHIQCMADQQSLEQIIHILLDNAIRYSPANTAITITGHTTGRYVTLAIKDQGPGIAAADVQHIFKRFYRAEASRAKHPSGHGLGLSIARKLAAQQRASIQVESLPGEGSTFTVRLVAASA